MIERLQRIARDDQTDRGGGAPLDLEAASDGPGSTG
jgi:hypothetical protein